MVVMVVERREGAAFASDIEFCSWLSPRLYIASASHLKITLRSLPDPS